MYIKGVCSEPGGGWVCVCIYIRRSVHSLKEGSVCV